MLSQKYLHWALLAALGIALTGCGDAETTINEKDPVVDEDDDHDHDHDHESAGHGRLVVTNNATQEALVYDLEDGSLLDAFALAEAPSAVYASGNYRYAVMANREGDIVNFMDGGVWQEDHVDHLHDYEEAPLLLDYSVTGSRPTHVVNHDGQIAVFFDGDATSGSSASISVFSDMDITDANTALPGVAFDTNMHGVAEPRGDHLFSSWRRDDAQSTSANPILPDQIAVYHLHDGEYEQEQILDVACPDLHGAAQNESFVIFGCSDGVVLVHEHDGAFEAEKILNGDDMAEGLRIGAIYGHEESEQFIAMASAHGGSSVQWYAIDPAEAEMELIDWQPVENATVVDRGFGFEAEQFLILDSEGYLTVIEPHAHDGHTHWEFGTRVDITEEDVATMPEGTNFSVSFAQNGHQAFVTDPIAQHILIVDLELMDIDGEIDLGFSPNSVTWLGIAESHEHED
ncbi:hypothetical protein TDB9533_03068 [Thalassocella blandensis]|nr:hypothetical protein TDB9533_03068 [Thalassocella blandensis]